MSEFTHDSKSRKRPTSYTYFGLELYVSPVAKNGIIRWIDISYREPRHEVDPRHLVAYGKTILKRRYTIESPSPIPSNEQVPYEIISATLQRVIPTLFLPILLFLDPSLKSQSSLFGLLAPYELHQIHSRIGPNEDEQNQLKKMISLWGENAICDITPSNLGAELSKMAPTTAKAFIRLLRKIYPCMISGIADVDPEIWKKYHFKGRRSSYSPSRVIRAKLLNKSLPEDIMVKCIEICTSNIWQGNEAEKYLVAMTILIEGIEIPEACALRRNSFQQLEGYPGRYTLLVQQALFPQGIRDKETEYQREQRHIIVDLAPPDNRSLGVCTQLAATWRHYLDSTSGDEDDLLLHNPQNTERFLHPDSYSSWLDHAFGHLMPSQAESVGDKEITSTYTTAQYFIASAYELLSKGSYYSSEELRYHFGQDPLQTDGKHYADFRTPSEVVTMGDIQHAAIVNLLGGEAKNSHSKKTHIISGKAYKKSHIRISLQIRGNESLDEGILFRLGALHGFNLDIELRTSENK